MPTPEDVANGWTQAGVSEYAQQVAQAERAALEQRLFPSRPPLRAQTVHRYNPHEW